MVLGLGCLWLSGGLLILRNVGHGSRLVGVAVRAWNLCCANPKDAPRGLGSAGFKEEKTPLCFPWAEEAGYSRQ